MGPRSNTAYLLAVILCLSAQWAVAHQDPPTCTSTGLAFDVKAFRADGVTEFGANESVSPCETIQYQVSIQYLVGTKHCGFEGGTMILQTPDGVFHDTAPAGGVPLISPFDGVLSVDGTKELYTVRSQDIFGVRLVQAVAYYACNSPNFPPGCRDAIAHTGPDSNDTLGILSQTTAAVAIVQPCPSPDPCVFACDPNKMDGGGRQGLCVDDPSYLKNACDDGDPCTDDTCYPDRAIHCPHTRICACGRGITSVCGPLQGSCDDPESCDGTNDTCPPDKVKQIGTLCPDQDPGSGNVCNGRDFYCPLNCGNGIVEPELGETCDDGKDYNGTPTDGCRRDCKLKCGDGNLDLLEQCDPAIPTETHCSPSCRLKCKSDSECRRDDRCTRFLCENNGLCATGMGCPGDPCTGASGDLDGVVCGFQRQLGGGNCAAGTNQEIAKSVNRHVTRLARKLETISALCGKAHGRKTIQQLLKGAGRKLFELQLLAARNVDRLCFHELNGSAVENDGRLDFLRLQVKSLRQDLQSGRVTCEQLKAGVQPSRDW